MVHDPWHGKSGAASGDFEGTNSVLAVKGSAVLRDGDHGVHPPRTATVSLPQQLHHPHIPASSNDGLSGANPETSKSADSRTTLAGGWSSDDEEEASGVHESESNFTLQVAAPNVRGYDRKKIEIKATTARFRVDALALTENRSNAQGLVPREDYNLWESGAEGADGHTLLVHKKAQLAVVL